MTDEWDELYMKCKVCCKELIEWATRGIGEDNGPESCAGCVREWEPIPWGEWGYPTRPCDRWKI